VKPAQFEYHAPTTPDAVIALLAEYRGEARLLAGGQSLVPMMNYRIVAPTAIVDLNRIPELAYIRAENGVVRIGAMTRQRAIEFSPVVAQHLPLLGEAIRLIAHLPIRSRGTIGGSLAHADPAAELPMVLQALDGEVVARGPAGERVIAAADLFRGLLTTSLADDEMIVDVRFRAMSPGTGFAVEEFARRARRLRDCRDRRGRRTRRRTLHQGAVGNGGCRAGGEPAPDGRGDPGTGRARRCRDRGGCGEGGRTGIAALRPAGLGGLPPPSDAGADRTRAAPRPRLEVRPQCPSRSPFASP
jgi:hypothetical protein